MVLIFTGSANLASRYTFGFEQHLNPSAALYKATTLIHPYVRKLVMAFNEAL